MLDLILAVDDPINWHKKNMEMNPDHYTPILPFNPTIISFIQNISAGLWYNSMVKINMKKYRNREIKYGVITTSKIYIYIIIIKYLNFYNNIIFRKIT